MNKALVMELARCEYVQRRENVIAVGNSGTGKTHVALGLGLAACQRGMSVGFTTAAGLVHELMEARDERLLLNLQRQLSRLNLLIIDELGFVPLSCEVATGGFLTLQGEMALHQVASGTVENRPVPAGTYIGLVRRYVVHGSSSMFWLIRVPSSLQISPPCPTRQRKRWPIENSAASCLLVMQRSGASCGERRSAHLLSYCKFGRQRQEEASGAMDEGATRRQIS